MGKPICCVYRMQEIHLRAECDIRLSERMVCEYIEWKKFICVQGVILGCQNVWCENTPLKGGI